MAVNQLAYYLEDLDRVKEISEEHVNGLIHQYHYCQSLHLIKAKQVFLKSNSIAGIKAIHAVDRNHFANQIQVGSIEKKSIGIDLHALSNAPVSLEDQVRFDTNDTKQEKQIESESFEQTTSIETSQKIHKVISEQATLETQKELEHLDTKPAKSEPKSLENRITSEDSIDKSSKPLVRWYQFFHNIINKPGAQKVAEKKIVTTENDSVTSSFLSTEDLNKKSEASVDSPKYFEFTQNEIIVPTESVDESQPKENLIPIVSRIEKTTLG